MKNIRLERFCAQHAANFPRRKRPGNARYHLLPRTVVDQTIGGVKIKPDVTDPVPKRWYSILLGRDATTTLLTRPGDHADQLQVELELTPSMI